MSSPPARKISYYRLTKPYKQPLATISRNYSILANVVSSILGGRKADIFRWCRSVDAKGGKREKVKCSGKSSLLKMHHTFERRLATPNRVSPAFSFPSYTNVPLPQPFSFTFPKQKSVIIRKIRG